MKLYYNHKAKLLKIVQLQTQLSAGMIVTLKEVNTKLLCFWKKND